MQKNLNYLGSIKTADERNLELRKELSELTSKLAEIQSASDYLRNTYDDLLPNDKTKILFDLSSKISLIKKNLQ